MRNGCQRPKHIPWEMLVMYEKEDGTTGSQELACTAGACDIADFTTEKVGAK